MLGLDPGGLSGQTALNKVIHGKSLAQCPPEEQLVNVSCNYWPQYIPSLFVFFK